MDDVFTFTVLDNNTGESRDVSLTEPEAVSLMVGIADWLKARGWQGQ